MLLLVRGLSWKLLAAGMLELISTPHQPPLYFVASAILLTSAMLIKAVAWAPIAAARPELVGRLSTGRLRLRAWWARGLRYREGQRALTMLRLN